MFWIVAILLGVRRVLSIEANEAFRQARSKQHPAA